MMWPLTKATRSPSILLLFPAQRLLTLTQWRVWISSARIRSRSSPDSAPDLKEDLCVPELPRYY